MLRLCWRCCPIPREIISPTSSQGVLPSLYLLNHRWNRGLSYAVRSNKPPAFSIFRVSTLDSQSLSLRFSPSFQHGAQVPGSAGPLERSVHPPLMCTACSLSSTALPPGTSLLSDQSTQLLAPPGSNPNSGSPATTATVTPPATTVHTMHP